MTVGNARLDLKEGQGPIILVGPRGPTRLTRPRAVGPASRGLRKLALFWGVLLLGAALGAVTLQALGPPMRPVVPVASTRPPPIAAPAPIEAGPAAVTPEAFPPTQTLETPSSRLAAGAFVAIPTPEVFPVPPLPVAVPRLPAPNAAATQAAPGASTVLPGQPNAPVRRAVIHYRAGSATEDVERLADRARTLAGRVELRAVPATPSRPGIRYFFNEDAGAAEALAAALASTGAGTFQVRGFPDYRPSPQPGTIEVWLP